MVQGPRPGLQPSPLVILSRRSRCLRGQERARGAIGGPRSNNESEIPQTKESTNIYEQVVDTLKIMSGKHPG
jgi:hypothetical protein